MTVLGLEASAGGAGAAVAGADGLLAASWLGPGARPAASLLVLAQRVLADAGLGVGDLEGVAVAAGPGSYAGVRAAVVSGKALAQAAALALCAVGSLEALALAAGPWPGTVWATIDARRGRLYAAAFTWGPAGLVPRREPALLERVDFHVAAAGPGPRLLLGTGVGAADVAALGGAAAGVWAGAAVAPAALAGAVALAGVLRLRAGGSVDPLSLVPQYVGQPQIGPVPSLRRVEGRGGTA